MQNQVILNKEARQKVKEGVDLVADPVKVTLGAGGRNVMCVRDNMMPVVTKDGVSIAQEVQHDDPIINACALVVKQVAKQTNDLAGDGTTTSTVLAQSIVNNAITVLDNDEKINAVHLKKGLDLATNEAITILKSISRKSSNLATLKNIAKISANGDKEISNLVLEAVKKVGKDGIIKVEESLRGESYIDFTKGYEFASPFSSYMYVTNQEKMLAEFADVNVLLYENYIEDLKQLDDVIKDCFDDSGVFKGLIIISDQISTFAENQIIKFKETGLKFMCVKSPSYGARRSEVMQDIAALIGANVIRNIEDYKREDLGFVTKIISDFNKTTLIGGIGSDEVVKDRIKVVNEQTKNTASQKERDFVKERLGKLKGGLAVINVGGYSDVERREKTDRVDDALCAVKACQEEGYVVGGGATYLMIQQTLKDNPPKNVNSSVLAGYNVLVESLSSPFRQICINAGITNIEEVENAIIRGEYGYGFNLLTEEYEDLFKAGVIDPTKVSRLALQNATSIVSTFLSIQAIVYNNTPVFGGHESI